MLTKTLQLALISLLTISCNKVQKIQSNTLDIQKLSQESKENYEGIIIAARLNPPAIEEIVERSNKGISQQTAIIEKAKDTIIQTSEVTDSVPEWMKLVELGLWVALVLGVIVGAWYLGLGTLTRRIIGYVPQAKKDEAKLLSEALDESSETDMREVVAYLRAKDPELNAAFLKRKKT